VIHVLVEFTEFLLELSDVEFLVSGISCLGCFVPVGVEGQNGMKAVLKVLKGPTGTLTFFNGCGESTLWAVVAPAACRR
jgi:hypothetical protein